MNDRGNIPSVHGVLHHYHPGGPVEKTPAAGTARKGPATGMSYYPGQFHSVQVPRTVRVDGYQGAQGSQPFSDQIDSRNAATAVNGYRGLTSADYSEHDWGYAPGAWESKLHPVEEDVGFGIGQASFGAQQPQVNEPAPESSPRFLNRSKTVSGQKRTAVGDIKQPTAEDTLAALAPDVNGSARHRSRSIGSTGHGGRIAALSAQLRNRLAYAAAKVERKRHTGSKSPLQSLQDATASPQISIDRKQTNTSCVGDNDSPEGTTVSAPDPPAGYNSHHPDSTAPSPELLSSYPNSHTAPQGSPKSLFPVPKLAPPVDIVSNGQSGRRRRPNPNEWMQPPRINPLFRHRRHHSQQEVSVHKPYPDYPGTPPLRPTAYPTSTPYNGASKLQTNSQNSSMEQDAIETLLFMSSPENSGYRSNTRQRQDAISNSIGSSMGGSSSVTGSSQPYGFNFQIPQSHTGMEAQAGDEIDRMLDQMGDSDSEDERRFVPSHSRSRTLH